MWKTNNKVFIVYFLLFCVGCTKAQQLTQIAEFGELKGTIAPVVQATVTLWQDDIFIQELSPDPQNGTFSIPELAPGPYTIKVAASDYQYYHQDINITAGQTNELRLSLTPVSATEPPATPPLPPPSPPINISDWRELITNLAVSKAQANQGEEITLTLTLTNPKNYPILISFPYCSWHPYFILTDTNNNEIWFSLHDMGFACMIGSDVLDPDETWTRTETWDGRDDHGNIVVPGTYSLTAIGLGYSELRPSLGEYTKSAVQKLYIQPADLSGFTGRITIQFKDDVTRQEARSILEAYGLVNLDFSLFAETILKRVYTTVPETEKAAIIQQLMQNPDIVEACPVSERE
jgi:hypothetical protein